MKILYVLMSIMCLSLSAQLQIRRNYFNDRVMRSSYIDASDTECCANQSGWYEPTSVAGAEDEVNRLRMEVINDIDKGTYIADWGKKRRRALDIQTKLGYTVPERYTWGD